MEITTASFQDAILLFFLIVWIYFLVEILVCRLIKKVVRSYYLERYEISKQIIAKEIEHVKKG